MLACLQCSCKVLSRSCRSFTLRNKVVMTSFPNVCRLQAISASELPHVVTCAPSIERFGKSETVMSIATAHATHSTYVCARHGLYFQQKVKCSKEQSRFARVIHSEQANKHQACKHSVTGKATACAASRPLLDPSQQLVMNALFVLIKLYGCGCTCPEI